MLAFLSISRSPYISLVVLVVGMIFFSHAAREDHRSEILYVLASIGAWFVVVTLVWPGLVGALLSQFLLFAGLTVFDTLRERKRIARGRLEN